MAMIKFGIISEVNPSKGTVRVSFPEDNVVSFPLPILTNGAKNNKFFYEIDINESVVCLMDENLENGVCLGAVYNDKNKPAASAPNDMASIVFGESYVRISKTGSEVEVFAGNTLVKIAPQGIEISKGGESLKTILVDLVTANSVETHTSAAPGSPTTPPINVASYTAILSRLNTFFTG